ncbi:MAG: hypothetical protein KAQ88_09645 [Hyphomicrobiaceae bacterium]|nr:hypothetical protein [Hyphomicrobiaceae bacterium]
MSESNEDANEFETPAEVQTPAEETAPAPSELPDAVKQALARQAPNVTQIVLAPCPCGTANVNLLIDIPQGSKVGRGTCGACGVWGVDFLAPRSQDKEIMGKAAAKAWNEAPR